VNTTPPSTLATLTGNSTQYIPTTFTSVSAHKLTGAIKGSNTVYVVAVDSEDNYSPSNYISGTFTLNSTNPDAPQNLSVSDASIKSEEIWRASLAWDAPSYKGTGSLTYRIQRSTDNSSWTIITTTSGLSYTDTVDESTTYYYRVGAYDTSDESEDDPTYSSSIEILPKGAYDEPATLSSGPLVSNITTKKALIKWSTSRTADSKVQYGTKSGDYFDDEASRSEQVTSHEIQLTNLEPGTKYYYKTKWTDEDGNTGESSEKTFSTDPAPKISAIKITNIGITSATVNFTAKTATKIKIYYGETNAFGSVSEQSTSTSESNYSIVLNGLDDNTKYFYKINAFDSEDAEYQGNELDFQTLPRPQITNVRVQQARNTAQPTAVISWSTNTEVSSIVSYYPAGNPSAVRDEVDIVLLKDGHRMIVRGLLPNTRYDLKVSGRDVAGNEAVSDILTFTTSTDTRPPLLSEVKVEGSSAIKNTQAVTSQLVITWTTDEAATSQVEFGEGTNSAYSQKTQEDSNLTFNHLVVIPNLTPSKVYHLRALSKDTAGNVSPSVDIVTITPKATENALDLVVTNLREVFNFIK
ncbi:fibronectin type III domain-containing protein, partial [Patescibacteria group bacterium]|nr:fibronectin type III domain-containing protein [Patescibacteria group bacterium]